jgi:hypothetical protein
MTNEQFHKWIAQHTKRFNLSLESIPINEWFEALEPYNLERCETASILMQRGQLEKPYGNADHIRIVCQYCEKCRVDDANHRLSERNTNYVASSGSLVDCSRCNDSGIVSVYHTGDLKTILLKGEKVEKFRSMGTACDCRAGERWSHPPTLKPSNQNKLSPGWIQPKPLPVFDSHWVLVPFDPDATYQEVLQAVQESKANWKPQNYDDVLGGYTEAIA